MNRLIGVVVLAIVGLVVLQAAGPTLVRLMHAAVPVVLVVGIVVLLARLAGRFLGR